MSKETTEQDLFDDMKKNGASVFFPQKKFAQAKDFIYLTSDGDYLHTYINSGKAPYSMKIDYDYDCSMEVAMIMEEFDKLFDTTDESDEEAIEAFWHKSQFTLYTPFDMSENHMIFKIDGDMYYYSSEDDFACKLIPQ